MTIPNVAEIRKMSVKRYNLLIVLVIWCFIHGKYNDDEF